jgi:hypothetical protein
MRYQKPAVERTQLVALLDGAQISAACTDECLP